MKVVSLRLNSNTTCNLDSFVSILTNNGYSVTFDRKGTKSLMARIHVSDAAITDMIDIEKDEAEEVVKPADDVEDVLQSFCKDKDMRYLINGGSILITTDIGFWKIVRKDDEYLVYHGNSYPTQYWPRDNRKDYHEQKDINKQQVTDFSEILIYIYSHDNFRRHELQNIRKPKNGGSKSQRKHYNEMKRKKQAYERCKSFQLLDKLSTRSL